MFVQTHRTLHPEALSRPPGEASDTLRSKTANNGFHALCYTPDCGGMWRNAFGNICLALTLALHCSEATGIRSKGVVSDVQSAPATTLKSQGASSNFVEIQPLKGMDA